MIQLTNTFVVLLLIVRFVTMLRFPSEAYIFSAGKNATKIATMFQSLGCQANIDSFHSMNFKNGNVFLAHPVVFGSNLAYNIIDLILLWKQV